MKVDQRWTARLKRFCVSETGTSAVEYAVMLALIIVVCLVALDSLGRASYEALWQVVDVLEE
jgi:pilus assembly protein Flp/PilA